MEGAKLAYTVIRQVRFFVLGFKVCRLGVGKVALSPSGPQLFQVSSNCKNAEELRLLNSFVRSDLLDVSSTVPQPLQSLGFGI